MNNTFLRHKTILYSIITVALVTGGGQSAALLT